MAGSQQTWWAVARSEEVTSIKPLAVDIGDQPIVLWRDEAGIARALEDRCPHRRAPLSLGCVRENGQIQCGYHGWSFDGRSGQLIEIPNIKEQRRYPPLYKANAFAISEQNGLVRVCLDVDAAHPTATGPHHRHSGTIHVSCCHAEYLNALYDDPSLVIAIRGVRFTPYLLSDLHEEAGILVMERSCQWGPLAWPSHFSAEFPLSLLIRSDPKTGETELTLRDDRSRPLVEALLAPVPAPRGVTAIRWRADALRTAGGMRAIALRGRMPFSVLPAIDGSKLRTTKPTVSLHGHDVREAALVGFHSPEAAAIITGRTFEDARSRQ